MEDQGWRKKMAMRMNPAVEFETARKAMNMHPAQMRARVTSILFENFDGWVSAKAIAEQIGTTPKFGKRGGEPCEVKHVMAKMTLGIIQHRLYRFTDYRLVIDYDKDRMLLTTKERAKGMETHILGFDHFEGHDPARNIRVDAEGRYVD
jgi:hypothetical protein